jgi:hypothetical protein
MTIGSPTDVIVKSRGEPVIPVVPADNYRATWVRLRRARLLLTVSCLAWLPVNGVASRLGMVPFIQIPWEGVSALVCASAFIAGVLLIDTTRCPRCQELFARNGWWQNAFTSKCLHCDLRQWQPSA